MQFLVLTRNSQLQQVGAVLYVPAALVTGQEVVVAAVACSAMVCLLSHIQIRVLKHAVVQSYARIYIFRVRV